MQKQFPNKKTVLKIFILQGAFLPVPTKLGGAVEKMWFALGKEFAKQGHEVIQISRSYKDYPEEEYIDDVLHTRVKGYKTPSNGLYLKFLDLLYSVKAVRKISKDADIIVTNSFWSPILIPGKLKSLCMVDVARMPKGQMRLYKQSMLRANSSPVNSAIRKELPYGISKRVVTIPNPLPFKDLPEVNLDEKKPFILYTGRVHPEKGLHILIEALSTLQKGWKLIIVGPHSFSEGGGGEKYMQELKKLAQQIDVIFTGPVNNDGKLNEYYKQASIFVYPSVAEKGETFGLAPLEAMAWGCVPVVSDLLCFQDFILPDKNGSAFNHRSKDAAQLLASAIKKLQHDPSLRKKIALQALKVRQSHGVSCIASDFLKLFQKMQNDYKTKEYDSAFAGNFL